MVVMGGDAFCVSVQPPTLSHLVKPCRQGGCIGDGASNDMSKIKKFMGGALKPQRAPSLPPHTP